MKTANVEELHQEMEAAEVEYLRVMSLRAQALNRWALAVMDDDVVAMRHANAVLEGLDKQVITAREEYKKAMLFLEVAVSTCHCRPAN